MSLHSWEKLPLDMRITAVNIDCSRHPKFAVMAGVIMMGQNKIKQIKTAATNGRDVHYGEAFSKGLDRKQLRYLALHENGHKALMHCVLPMYKQLNKKYPKLSNQAQDYVINGWIEELDPNFEFVDRPCEGLCVDKRFDGMSFIDIMKILIKEAEERGDDPTEDKDDEHDFDEHIDGDQEFAPEEQEQIQKEVDSALRQGEFLARKLAGKGSGGRDIFGLAQDRSTNWIDPMREFIEEMTRGDENGRLIPPNKRMFASGYIFPSRYDETVGDLVIACDTSGSMGPYYTLIFGEIARICQDTKPQSVRVLWWDSEVCHDQVFKPDDYGSIATLLKPKGGGGTDPQCVVDYMKAKEIKPKAMIWITDGYIGGEPHNEVPALWGVVGNDHFVPRFGKLVRIPTEL